jgi:hypothetical protein
MADKEGNFTGDGLWVTYKMADMLAAVQNAYGTPHEEVGVGGYTPQEISEMYEENNRLPAGRFSSDQIYHAKKAIDTYRREHGLPPRVERVQTQSIRKSKRMIEIEKLMTLGVSPEDIAGHVDQAVKTVRRAINRIKEKQREASR